MIESTEYRREISEPGWRFSAYELRKRERIAAEAEAGDFAFEMQDDGVEKKLDEFRCEQFLRESDARTEHYLAAHHLASRPPTHFQRARTVVHSRPDRLSTALRFPISH